MAYLCGNCGTPLVFDPGTQRVRCSICNGRWYPEEVRTSRCEKCGTSLEYDPLKQIATCRKCGLTFFPEQIKNKEREYLESIKAEPAEPPTEGAIAEFIDCFIYACSSCGGKVIINGTEISTICVYCGSPSVVFERISKEKAPEFILPFKINQELALQNVREKLNEGKFIPKDVKDIQLNQVRGIYIPYWICDGIHAETTVHAQLESRGYDNSFGGNYRNPERVWRGTSGIMEFSNLTQDASLDLPDDASLRLEPFDLRDLKFFNEGYLLGFYANLSDINKSDLISAVNKRMNVVFEQEALGFRNYDENKCKKKVSNTLINEDVRYALLPVWFISFDYRGKHHTMLVNGESGKVVGGIPWKNSTFAPYVIGLGILLSAGFTWLCYKFIELRKLLSFGASLKITEFDTWLFVLVATLAGVLISTGIRKIKKVTRQLRLTRSAAMFHFARKRQG